MNKREILCDMGYDDLIIFDDQWCDDSIIGVTTDSKVVYDYNLLIENYCRENNCGYEDAVEWIDYNTVRSLPYTDCVIMYPMEDCFE